jgi:hypothetical protein
MAELVGSELMTKLTPRAMIAATLCATGLLAANAAHAEKIVANCTGMVNFDIYTIDTELEEQEIEIIGQSTVEITEEAILLTGAYGEVRFDLKVGTLYENGTDTGVYCTYSRKP